MRYIKRFNLGEVVKLAINSNSGTEKNGENSIQLPDVSPDILLEIMRTRRAVRHFKSEPISGDVLEQLYEAARWAPTNCNKQLWRMVVIDDHLIKETLVREAGASTLILRVPILMVVIHYNDVYLEAYQAASAAVQNMLLMANALGLGSLWLNSKGNPDKYREVLGIPEEYIITNLILLGYPAGPVLPPPRREINEFFFQNQFPKGDRQKWVHDPEKWRYESLAEYQRFICRKTDLGTCQDVFGETEGKLVAEIAEDFQSPHVDLFSYDGHMVKFLPERLEVTIIDSGKEPSRYSQETLKGRGQINCQVWEQFIQSPDCSYATASLLFRAERLPSDFLREMADQVMMKLVPGGTLFLVFRNRNIFFLLFYKLLISVLGDNLSKTAIYAFFGPYKPGDTKQISLVLANAGFNVRVRKRYPVPPIFARIAELITQYRLSKGGNFMHTLRHRNSLSRTFDLINRVQMRYSLPWFGSISVVTAVKPLKGESQSKAGDIRE